MYIVNKNDFIDTMKSEIKGDYYAVENTNDIRPYGILLKK